MLIGVLAVGVPQFYLSDGMNTMKRAFCEFLITHICGQNHNLYLIILSNN